MSKGIRNTQITKDIYTMIGAGYTVAEMIKEIGAPRATIMRHIRVLVEKGLVRPHPNTWEVTENGKDYFD